MIDEKQQVEDKLVLLGDTSLGKTCLFKKLTKGNFMDKNISTIGMDKKTLNIEIDVEENEKSKKKLIAISLVDTAGQERFRTITKSYIKGSDGIILMYDLTNKDSFLHVEEWVNSIFEGLGNVKNSPYLILLLGNKLDLINNEEKQREVTTEEGENKCKEQGLDWGKECSVKDFTLEQFNDLFKNFVEKIYKKVGDKSNNKQVAKKLGGAKKQKKTKFC